MLTMKSPRPTSIRIGHRRGLIQIGWTLFVKVMVLLSSIRIEECKVTVSLRLVRMPMSPGLFVGLNFMVVKRRVGRVH